MGLSCFELVALSRDHGKVGVARAVSCSSFRLIAQPDGVGTLTVPMGRARLAINLMAPYGYDGNVLKSKQTEVCCFLLSAVCSSLTVQRQLPVAAHKSALLHWYEGRSFVRVVVGSGNVLVRYQCPRWAALLLRILLW